MKCPRDNTLLHPENLHNIPVDACEKCGGIFFDAGELERMVKTYMTEAVQSGKQVADINNEKYQKLVSSEYLTWVCPKDSSAMERIAYANDPGTAIEHCTTCNGWWFDRDDVGRALALHVPNVAAERAAVLILKEETRIIKQKDEDARQLNELKNSILVAPSQGDMLFFVAKVLQIAVQMMIEKMEKENKHP